VRPSCTRRSCLISTSPPFPSVARGAEKSPFDRPVSRVEVGRRNGDWRAFVFVDAEQGSAWVPAGRLSADARTAEVPMAYDTTELPTQVGDIREVLERHDESAWHWCRAAYGTCGWVPTRTLAPA
jgi:hypothetical protein